VGERGLGQGEVADPGLDACSTGQRIEFEDAVQAREREHDTPGMGERAARESRAGAPCDDRDPEAVAGSQHRDDFGFRGGQGDRERHLAQRRESVAFVGHELFGCGQQRPWRQDRG
jgi:hypothetical protein